MVDRLPRVLSYPPRHDYVDRLHGTVARLVHRDQDWPTLPELYDPDWITARYRDWDIAHFHFTWEQYPIDRFREVLRAHRDNDRRVVWTAHDLRNPHTGDASQDDVYLDALAEHADHVLTLTEGAAAVLRDRWGIEATVVPHGPLVAPVDLVRWRAQRAARRPSDPPSRLLLHARSLRANLDWHTPCEVVRELATRGESVELTLSVHPDAATKVPHDWPGVRVDVHERWSFDALCAGLASTDAVVLPYRWGTHSGLLELAADLDVPALAADVGFLAEQVPALTFPVGREGIDAGGFGTAIAAWQAGQAPVRPSPRERAEARQTFLAVHGDLYARLSPVAV